MFLRFKRHVNRITEDIRRVEMHTLGDSFSRIQSIDKFISRHSFTRVTDTFVYL